jgi:DNA-binding beta-propeller fold protein YncE
LAEWLVPTASAKWAASPAAVLSPDGQRLYFLDVVDFEKGNGLWAIQTNSLKPLGHWLKGKDITGVQISRDGREVYAASYDDHTLYVLDAFSGEVRRAFDKVAGQLYGFASE